MFHHRPVSQFLVFVALGLGLVATPVLAGQATIVLEAPGKAGEANIWLVPLRPGPGIQPVSATIQVPGQRQFELADGPWRIAAQAAGLFFDQAELNVSSTHRSLGLKAVPGATVRAKLRAKESGATLPPEVVVEARIAEGKAKDRVQTATCPAPKGQLLCPIPAGTFDLKIRIPGFASFYRWNAKAPVAGVFDFGELVVEKGASLVGWVVSETGSLPPGLVVELVSASYLAVQRPDPKLVLAKAELRPNGFFHFEGLGPGKFLAVARTADGFSAHAEVETLEGREAILRSPLLLTAPVEVELILSPPLAPGGAHWTIVVLKEEAGNVVTPMGAATPAGDDGRWKRAGLARARYFFRVIAPDGAVFFHERIDLATTNFPLFVDMPLIELDGTVLLGRDPLPKAELIFGGRSGAVKVATRSDEEGRFHLTLPRAGNWKVAIHADDPSVRHQHQVTLEERDGAATVEIRLPTGRLAGKVLGPGGQPAPQAQVNAQKAGLQFEHLQLDADAQGVFELAGLDPGRWKLWAADRDLSSRPQEIDLEGEQEGLELRLERQLFVEGQVFYQGRPLPGAHVLLMAPGDLAMPQIRADGDGRFRAQLPPDSREVLAYVFAPLFGFSAQRVPVSSPGNLRLEIGSDSGELLLDLSGLKPDEAAVIYVNGVVCPINILKQWASTAGKFEKGAPSLQTSGMPPGEYRLCRLPLAGVEQVHVGLAVPISCKSGTLAAADSLELALPRQ